MSKCAAHGRYGCPACAETIRQILAVTTLPLERLELALARRRAKEEPPIPKWIRLTRGERLGVGRGS
jgi:hypothetical protein